MRRRRETYEEGRVRQVLRGRMIRDEKCTQGLQAGGSGLDEGGGKDWCGRVSSCGCPSRFLRSYGMGSKHDVNVKDRRKFV